MPTENISGETADKSGNSEEKNNDCRRNLNYISKKGEGLKMNRHRYFLGNASSFILSTTGILSTIKGLTANNLTLLTLGLAQLGLLTGFLAISIQINEVNSE